MSNEKEKTNPSGYRRATWTTPEYIPPAPDPHATPAAAPEPTNLEFAAAVLDALIPFPDAYRAMLQVAERFWPFRLNPIPPPAPC